MKMRKQETGQSFSAACPDATDGGAKDRPNYHPAVQELHRRLYRVVLAKLIESGRKWLLFF
jgi:hypothetical protein